MAEIKTLFDGRQIFLGQDGFPLIFGKVFFYDVGTTNPKTAYSDAALTTPVSNPLILGNDGRSEVQVFLGQGQYTVHIYKFNGIDPITADPGEWSLDNEFDAEGVTAVTASTDVFTVDTLADLRLVDQSAHNFVRVLGYYAAGDMFPRDYYLKSNADADNGGTIVKDPGIAGTSWLYYPEGEDVDCRIFGVIPGLTTAYNSQLQSAVTWCTNEKRTLYLRSGVYYLENGSINISCKISIDDGVYFRVVSGSYVATINAEYDIRLKNNIKHPLGADSYFIFSASSIGTNISPRIYGAKLDGVTDDFAALDLMTSYVRSKSAKIQFDGISLISTATGDLTFKNDIVFVSNSGINNQQTDFDVVFNGITFDNKNNGSYNTIAHPINVLLGNVEYFYFLECDGVRSSWFGAATQGNTVNLSPYVSLMKCSNGTKFIFDSPNNIFSDSVTIANSQKWDFVHESGVISNTGASAVVYLNNLNASAGVQCISTTYPIIIYNGEIHYTWFIPIAATATQRKNGFTNAIRCALFGSGLLNLDNLYSSSDPFPIIDSRSNFLDSTISSTSERGIEIYNGRVLATSAVSYLVDIQSISINKIEIRSVFMSAESGVGCGFLKMSTGSLYDLCVKNSKCVSATKGTVAAFDLSSVSTSGKFYVDNNEIVTYTLFSSEKPDQPVRITNNYNLDCIVDLPGIEEVVLSKNTIPNGSLIINSYNSFISGIFNENNIGTGTIVLDASSVTTRLYNLYIKNNIVADISATKSGSGAFDTSGHKSYISDNMSGSSIVQSTKASTYVGFNYDATGLGVGDIISTDITMPDDFFSIPDYGVLQMRIIGIVDQNVVLNPDSHKLRFLWANQFGVGTLRINLIIEEALSSATGTIEVNISFQSFR